uniref:Protein FAM166B n=1 Tax=Arion vulgaris TaxID=1028688 RepID=A0A0B6YVV5_9EUPU
MTAISTGGGPTLEQRRAFSGLKEGAEVPGYKGYIPQIKYRVGGTFGNDTSALSQEYGIKKSSFFNSCEPEVLVNRLPDAGEDKKFTDCMVPGYTGYVPRLMFRYGGTYRHDCDHSIDNFLTNRETYAGKQDELFRHTQSNPRLTAISYDPEVRDKINRYRDTHALASTLRSGKRPMREPPIPGYEGYVPRINTTDMGLGKRYHCSTDSGLELFAREQQHHKMVNSTSPVKPITLGSPAVDFTTSETRPGLDYSTRIYMRDGMIPKYTGYIPHRRYVFGHTYGDETRDLEVCAHNAPNFGVYTRSKTMA